MASNLQFALASAQAEAKLALVQFNFDFALVKREAPLEYQGVGTHISAKRRNAAESGTIHKTAQRLGALFQSTLPRVSALIRVYGLRSSEISTKLDSTSKTRGIFREYTGLDTTSLYAAATSSDTAIAVHLLACFLARLFDARNAVAIWEELIASHKENLLGDNGVTDLERAAIASIEIQHSQLQEWDNSARAWLSAADKLPKLATKQTQLKLILNNIGHIQVDHQPSPYKGVLTVWKTALKTMDQIVGGASFAITDGAVLTAVSAWHLYPDIVVLGSRSKLIKQDDDLLTQAGHLTVGIQSTAAGDPGVYWSLPLSHLRFYGPPTIASGSWKIIPKRLSFEQFLYAMLGCAFRCWNVVPSDFEACARSLVLCAKCCFDTPLSELGPLISGCNPNLLWFAPLAYAANAYQQSTTDHRSQIERILKMGYKRPSPLLQRQNLRKSRYDVFFMHKFQFFDWITDHTVWLRVMRGLLQHMPPSYSQGLIVRRTQNDSGSGASGEQLECLYPRFFTTKGKKLLLRWIVGDDERPPSVEDDTELLEQNVTFTDVMFLRAFNSLTWKNCPMPLIEPASDCSNSATSQSSSNPDWWPGQVSQNTPVNSAPEIRYDLLVGDPDSIALLAQRNSQRVTQKLLHEYSLPLKDLANLLESNVCDPELVKNHFTSLPDDDQFMRALHVLGFITQLYVHLPEATVATSIFDHDGLCLEQFFVRMISATRIKGGVGRRSKTKCRHLAFEIIAALELGQSVSSMLSGTFAICAQDSIYLAEELFADPCERDNSRYIRRIFGNIGEAGLVFLIEPDNPQIRKAKAEEWNVVSHNSFDGQWEDNFTGTSLHLKFTGWKTPLVIKTNSGTRFTDTNAMEAVVSVYDTGAWVGDLRLKHYLHCDWASWIIMVTCSCVSPEEESADIGSSGSLVCIDTWPELLDAPLGPAVVRAQGNSEARLATLIVCHMRGYTTVLFGKDKCWKCARSLLENHPRQPNLVQAYKGIQTSDQVIGNTVSAINHDADTDDETRSESGVSCMTIDDNICYEEMFPVYIL